VLRVAVVGLLLRVGIAVAIACLVAAVLGVVREGSSFADGFRISSVARRLRLRAARVRRVVHDDAERHRRPAGGELLPEAAAGDVRSSGALFVLTALVLFGLGVALG
jgi:hypothetical protein